MLKKVLSTTMSLSLVAGISCNSASAALPPFRLGDVYGSSPQVVFFLGNENQNKWQKELILNATRAQFAKLVSGPFESLSERIKKINDSHKGIREAVNLKKEFKQISRTVDLYHRAIDGASAPCAMSACIPSYENFVNLNTEIQNLDKKLDSYLQQHTHK